jgi:subtilisin family serine protease
LAVRLPGKTKKGVTFLPNEVIVKYKKGFTRASATGALSRMSATEVARLRHVGLSVVRMNRQASELDRFVRDLNLDPAIEYAEKIPLAYAQIEPADPDFGQQWPLHNAGQSGGANDADIDALEAWDVDDGSSTTIVVAVIDTGIDYSHPDLAANIWTNPDETPGDGIDNDLNGFVDDVHGYDFFGNDGDPMDDHSHGTHVAGTIAAVGNNGIGVAGVSWNAQIMAVKFLDSRGQGTMAGAVEAIDYAVAQGATVSNNSWGVNMGS